MYKQRILLALLLCSIISFSQEIVNSTPVALKKNIAAFQVVNEASKETTLFVGDKEKVKAIRLNSEMKIIDSISAIRLNAKLYSTMIGYNENKSNTNLVWSSSNHKDIFIQQFNFDKLISENKTFTLTLKNEKYVQNFSQNGKFYLMTVIKSSDKLKLYVFDTDGKLEEKTIDLKGLEFLSFDNKKITLYEKLKEEFNGSDFPFSMQLIRSENPTSLVESAKKRKCYSNGTSIVITFDSNLDFTQLITINLENFFAKQHHINKPIIPGDKAEQNSNSFFIDNHLYQIKTSSSFLIFTVKDLEDNLIKSYKASDKKPIIDFKNNDYVQENGDTANTRILETASQFIRKTNNLNSGISCYKLNDNYLVTIGSISGQQDALLVYFWVA